MQTSYYSCPHFSIGPASVDGTFAGIVSRTVVCSQCEADKAYPSVRIDGHVNAAYVALKAGAVARTVDLTKKIKVDYDIMGQVVGVEILGYA